MNADQVAAMVDGMRLQMEQQLEQRIAQQLSAQQQQQQAAHAQEMSRVQQQMEAALAQQALQALQAQQAQLAQAHHALQARPSSVRPANVPEYVGKMGTLDSWLSSMEQQFEFHNLSTDADRIRNAAVMLRGPALSWWQTILPSGAERSSWAQMQLSMYAR